MKMERPINIEKFQRIINFSKKSVVKIIKQSMSSTEALCNVHFNDKKTFSVLKHVIICWMKMILLLVKKLNFH